MQYRDVLIHTDASLARDYSHLKAFPPIRRRIDLSAEIWIGPLDAEVAKSVLDACDKRTFGPVPHVRMSHQLYAFVRESTDFNNSCAWDNDHRLEATVAVSRLVHGCERVSSWGQVHCSSRGVSRRLHPYWASGLRGDGRVRCARQSRGATTVAFPRLPWQVQATVSTPQQSANSKK